jgi:two-component system, NarL family, nitrate/nitrite response regulator NarL
MRSAWSLALRPAAWGSGGGPPGAATGVLEPVIARIAAIAARRPAGPGPGQPLRLLAASGAQLRAAITAVARGKDWISPRLAFLLATDEAPDRPGLSVQETRALRLYSTGMPMKSVAQRMCISEETAKQYVGRVREKYSRAGRAAPTKIELYHRAVEDGHLPPHP